MDDNVKNIVKKSREASYELRLERRLESQTYRRNLSESEFKGLTEKEIKSLIAQCKTGKISVEQLRQLCECLHADKANCDMFFQEEGCLHALVGIFVGREQPKQVLAVQCLANMAAHKVKPLVLARAAGPYLVTHLSGSDKLLSEYSSISIANIANSEDKAAVKVLVNQEAVPSLLILAQASTESLQESALLGVYNIVRQADLDHDELRSVTSAAMKMLTTRPPMNLLWVLYALSTHQILHNQLSSRQLLNTCLNVATYEIFQKCDSRPLLKLLTPMVRLLANLSGGPDSVSVCLNLVRHPDFSAILTALLTSHYRHLCKESTWLFANIVNNENVTVQEEFVNLDLMDKLEVHVITAVNHLDYLAHNNEMDS